MNENALPPLRKDEAAKLRSVTIAQVVDDILARENRKHEEADADLAEVSLAVRRQHVLSALNIQHWKLPHEARPVVDWYYRQTYARWKEWLLEEAGRMVPACDYLSGFELRSLLTAYGDTLLEEWRKSCARVIEGDLYLALCDFCFIPRSLSTAVTQRAAEQVGGAVADVGVSAQTTGEFGLGYFIRDKGGAEEEKAGILEFCCVTNDRTPGSQVRLLTLKSIFSRQLPRMPREYITRLTFDRQHYSFCLLKSGRVVGGVCFRPFFQSRFAEIVFLAITSQEQVKGYGTRLMNHLKEFMRLRGFEYFLTYADNFALGYFRKQGFSTTVTMHKDRWVGYIKDYDGGTLMECAINPNINYLELSALFVQQRRMVSKALRMISVPRVYNGRALWRYYRPYTQREFLAKYPPNVLNAGAPSSVPLDQLQPHVDPSTIPGFVENGWLIYEKNTRTKVALPLNDQILKFLEQMSKHEAAWPFQKPVSKVEAPDYHEHVKHPMDISQMRKNAKNKVYKTKDEFAAHLKLMFDNCRYYNQEHSIYYKLAADLEASIAPAFEELIDV